MKKIIRTSDFVHPPLLKKFSKLAEPLTDQILGLKEINKFYTKAHEGGGKSTSEFCQSVLKNAGIKYSVDPEIKTILEEKKPLIILANHPYGSFDSLALIDCIENHVNREWKIVANRLLLNIEELSEHVILVDPNAKGEQKKENLKSIRLMQETLKNNNILILFPASRVSGYNTNINAVYDLPWSEHPLKLAKKYNANILLLHISGQNSKDFLNIPPEKFLKRSIRLAKEVKLIRNTDIKISFSRLLAPAETNQLCTLEKKQQQESLRAMCYIGADKTTPVITLKKPTSQSEKTNPLPSTGRTFLQCLREKAALLCSEKEFESFFFKGDQHQDILQEIGRQRSITFSEIGAGSGQEIDLSEEDNYYHHIIVIEKSTGRLIGAYRVGLIQEILEELGQQSIYLNSVFKIDPEFFSLLGNAIELSRSFIIPEFQKNPKILDLLWKSLGAVAKQKNCDYMFGSVTISDKFTPLSKAILVDTLDRYHSAELKFRKNIDCDNAFSPTTTYHSTIVDAFAQRNINSLNPIIEELEAQERSIPPLIRYYLTLGAKFIAFKEEPTFNNAIYCLLIVKLSAMPPRYQKRFLP